jgi:hypothetical protein
MLINLPGTTMIFFGVPSMNFCTASEASAAASMAALSASLAP